MGCLPRGMFATPPICGRTYTCENITLPQTSFTAGNKIQFYLCQNPNRYYRPQRSWGKVIFSKACVILFTGEGVHGPGGVPGPGGFLVRGVPGPGGSWWTPPPATATGGTHPTGMHSCWAV